MKASATSTANNGMASRAKVLREPIGADATHWVERKGAGLRVAIRCERPAVQRRPALDSFSPTIICLIRTDLKVVRLPSRICRLSVAAMDALLALVRDRPAAFTTQPISREFDEAGVKRDRRWLEQLREREHVRNRPTRLLRPIRLRRIADGNEECRDLIIAETKLT